MIQVAGDVHGSITAGPGAETPRQTPPPAPGFVDRHELLNRLAGLVAGGPAPPRIAVISGPPGIGKRAAARQFAYLFGERFPGGDLHVACADFRAGRGAADLGGMLAACLSGLGVREEHLPGATGARSNLLRSRTARAAVLVVVEDATEPAQVRALLPKAPGSLVLVTTCADLAELRLDGAVFLEVGALDDESGSELFAHVAGVPAQGAGADLVRLCAGLPLAILALGARVAALHGATLGDLAAELADESRRLSALSLGGREIVSENFTASYERLPEPARRLYRRLGLLPVADIAVDTAAVAASLEPKMARALLDTLADARLLERRPEGRFGFHELIRAHAAGLAAEEPREAVLRRVVRFYLARTALADRAVMGERTRIADHGRLPAVEEDPFAGPDPKAAALAWLRAERANLVTIVRTAADRGWDAECWQLAEALTAYYLNHRHLGDWLTTSHLGIEAARRCGDERAEARLRMLVSRAHGDRGETRESDAESAEAVRLAERAGDPILLASAWEFRGRHLDRADPAAALDAYRRAHDLNADAGEWRGVALTLYFEACALTRLGRPAEALPLLDRARDLLAWLGDTRMTGRALIATADALTGTARDDEAAGALRQALPLLAGLHYEAEAHERLADLATRRADPRTARTHLEAALHIYRSTGHPHADRLAPHLRPSST
ncbi:hypothetical protein [Bailinhaonella thermotolerans]|uniref:NB-ARC domain-containing protein n=1 Tax=Bailinhaonella thermotolerans TaxID=1070861 RepID=A0A3A4A289_9ACTN|nr:hypothetical protein [Bailinhaonella thermotolerans]RJL20696.1 hypothetical protein D5H75_39215 [Bailinhaonella thermotolerans]